MEDFEKQVYEGGVMKRYRGFLVMIGLLYGFALATANPWYLGFGFASFLLAIISLLCLAIKWILYDD